jgi:hypothetical protein
MDLPKRTGLNSFDVCQIEPFQAIPTAMCEKPASARDDVVREVARMIAEWERGDELPTELAGRLVDYFASKNLDTSEARDCA